MTRRCGIGQDGHAVGEVKPASHDKAHPGCLGSFMCPHDPGNGIAVSDRHGVNAEGGSLREQLLARGRTPQEAEVGGRTVGRRDSVRRHAHAAGERAAAMADRSEQQRQSVR
jgi:hypothetical protein